MGKKSQLPARNKHLAIRQNHCLTKETINHPNSPTHTPKRGTNEIKAKAEDGA
jgi:hypothetical protein